MCVGLFTAEMFVNWVRKENWRGGFRELLTAKIFKRKINPPDK